MEESSVERLLPQQVSQIVNLEKSSQEQSSIEISLNEESSIEESVDLFLENCYFDEVGLNHMELEKKMLVIRNNENKEDFKIYVRDCFINIYKDIVDSINKIKAKGETANIGKTSLFDYL